MNWGRAAIRSIVICIRLILVGLAFRFVICQAQTTELKPVAPTTVFHQFAPDREYDLKNVLLDIDIDFPHRKFTAAVQNTIIPFQNGLKVVVLNCGKNLSVESCTVNGANASFVHENNLLRISPTIALPAGKEANVGVRYKSGDSKSNGTSGLDTGFHWIKPEGDVKSHVGFWTHGETSLNQTWIPTWDYPNNLATSETRTTVPAAWTVIGNGILKSNKLSVDGKRRTFDWKMTKPHATYLLSLVGGPFDIKTVRWRGIPVMYVVPKGEGNLIDASFGDTPDMLSFFSDTLGVKYPWPKYAEDAVFGGDGMENVSASTLFAESLTDNREWPHAMAWLNSHELAHQWFGDLVTCRDWGNVWLNEGFATFLEVMYAGHVSGETTYAYELQNYINLYLSESRQFKGPLVDNRYADPQGMFGAHSYFKGAAVLHTMRRYMGDRLFFAGLKRYLETYKHTPVVTDDLCRALTDASGINMEPFFKQWVYSPGHPVLDYTWTWDSNKVNLRVSQKQDTKDGTPIYAIKAVVGVIRGGKLSRRKIFISKAEETFSLESEQKPDAVLLDPDHDFLREIPELHWSATELPAILQYGSNPVDRSEALTRLLSGVPSTEAINFAVAVIRKDNTRFPVLYPTRLGELKREDLRQFFREELHHANNHRRVLAINALGRLQPDAADTAALSSLINDVQPYDNVVAAINALGGWDALGNKRIILRAASMYSLRESIRSAAFSILAKENAPELPDILVIDCGSANHSALRLAAIDAMGKLNPDEPKTHAALLQALEDESPECILHAAQAFVARKDASVLGDLRKIVANPKDGSPKWLIVEISEQIKELEKTRAN